LVSVAVDQLSSTPLSSALASKLISVTGSAVENAGVDIHIEFVIRQCDHTPVFPLPSDIAIWPSFKLPVHRTKIDTLTGSH
jgi:hypothetical protein